MVNFGPLWIQKDVGHSHMNKIDGKLMSAQKPLTTDRQFNPISIILIM